MAAVGKQDKYFEKLCSEDYLGNRDTACEYKWSFFGPRVLLFQEMKEIFNGYFSNINVYLLYFGDAEKPEHSREIYPAVYAVNTVDSSIMRFRSDMEYCSFINSCQKPLARLDKAYLYLCLYYRCFQKTEFGIEEPAHYHPDECKSSLFANRELDAFFHWPGCDYYRSRATPVSLADSIEMYFDETKCNLPEKSHRIRHVCHFTFSNSGDLISIKTDSLITR